MCYKQSKTAMSLENMRILVKKNGRNFYIKVGKREPVAQLVDHWGIMGEVVSSTQAGPSLTV